MVSPLCDMLMTFLCVPYANLLLIRRLVIDVPKITTVSGGLIVALLIEEEGGDIELVVNIFS